MISPLDDFLCHQTVRPIADPGTTDPNFVDRYYFNTYSLDDEVAVLVGMTQYPNRGVADSFVLVAAEGVQHVVRASRELGDRFDTRIGPISVEIIEGLRELRIICDENDGGIAMDLKWSADNPPLLEPPALVRNSFGRVSESGTRYVQTGRWDGSIRIGNRVEEVSADRWRGTRDHFWGVRRLPQTDPARPGHHLSGLVVWAPIRLPTSTLHLVQFAQPDGQPTRQFCQQVPHHGQPGTSKKLELSELLVDIKTSTQILAGGELRLIDPTSGETMEFEIVPRLSATLGVGTGYGGDGATDWLHGMYQGPLAVQCRRYDLGTALQKAINTTFCDFRSTHRTGQSGTGMIDFMATGDFVQRASRNANGHTRVRFPLVSEPA